MIIGIDLGTTYSVIAIKGDVKVKGNYPSAQYLSDCDVSLIPSPAGEFAIPSAFWESPNDPKSKLFGSEAKDIATQGETPILFSKRCIGTTQKLRIGPREYTAKQVATEILRYLKKCAEDALGTDIGRAVITHPAYFNRNQVEETREAAIAAGFDMSYSQQMLMEPVAAALAHIATDPREKLTAMTYDLGGGTFDVTILERRDGVTCMKAFDGNPLLGGYNFDRRLVKWLLERVAKSLENTGRTFTLDENNPSDQSTWSRLLQLAETVKYALVSKPTAKVPAAISAPDILRDTNGKPIKITDRITRGEYAALITDLLDDTIERSKGAIDKAGIKPDELDVIVIVGGSSYGQWVRDAVKNAFPSNEILFHGSPDLCVAAGAAIFASTQIPDMQSNTGGEFEILPDVPSVSLTNPVHILGSVRKQGGKPLPLQLRQELQVFLKTPESGEAGIGPASLNEESCFLFRDVELACGEPTRLTLRLVDSQASKRAEQDLTIEYKNEGGSDVIPPDVLPKPIYLRTGSGLLTIASEAQPLPVKSKQILLEKLHGDSTIDLDVYQGPERITTIRVEGIPEDAGTGSTVLFTVQITKQNVMRGNVVVRKMDGSVATEWPVEISFPPLEIPSLPQLEEAFKRLDARRLELIAVEHDGARRVALGGPGPKQGGGIAKRIKNLLAETFKNSQEIYQGILELEQLISAKRDEMDPPLRKFDALVNECHKELAKSEEPDKKEIMDRLEIINQTGHDAEKLRDKRKWSIAWTQLRDIHAHIVKPPDPEKTKKEDDDEEDDWTAADVKDAFFHEIVEWLRVALSAKQRSLEAEPAFEVKYLARCEAVEKQIDDIELKIRAVDSSIKHDKAYAKLEPLKYEKAKIKKRIDEIDIDIATKRS
jgi:hypothetical protein